MNDRQWPSSPPARQEIVPLAVQAIRSRLPQGWALEVLEEVPNRSVDAVIQIDAPNGEVGKIVVQAKNAFDARDVVSIMNWVTDPAGEFLAPAAPMVIARYLNARVRDRLEAEEIAYADATGNLFLKLSKPALFLRDVGAARDPWRGPGRPRGSFRGPIAARVVRALVDFAPPMTVPELIKCSEVSTGAGYRVVEFLEREDLVERRRRGPITRVEWRPILERWAEDYGLDLEEDAMRFLAPRGIKPLLKKLRSVRKGGSYVLTGSAAATFFEEYAQTRMALIYAVQPQELANELELRPVETGANALLVRPSDEVVFARSTKRDGLQIAAPSQIVADLLNGPGRAPAEADALLDWMRRNESVWRR
jgi:transcriptional regulator with AbiEi antitoxin domain of type IV toxin-antitoxin system